MVIRLFLTNVFFAVAFIASISFLEGDHFSSPVGSRRGYHVILRGNAGQIIFDGAIGKVDGPRFYHLEFGCETTSATGTKGFAISQEDETAAGDNDLNCIIAGPGPPCSPAFPIEITVLSAPNRARNLSTINLRWISDGVQMLTAVERTFEQRLDLLGIALGHFIDRRKLSCGKARHDVVDQPAHIVHQGL